MPLSITFEDRMMLKENSYIWMNEYEDVALKTMKSNPKGYKIIQSILNANDVVVNEEEDLHVDDDA